MPRKRSGEEIGERLRQLLIQQEDLRGQLAALTERMSDEVAELEHHGGSGGHEAPERRIGMDKVLDLLGHLAIAPTESDACEVIVSAARYLLPGTRGALCLAGDDGAMAVAAVWDAEDQWNRPYRRREGGSPPQRLAGRVSAGPTGQGWVYPARGFGLLVGELRVWPENDQAATEAVSGRCELLARSAGLVLAGMTLQRRLRDEAVRDPMTGLLNRAYFAEALPRELARAAAGGDETGLIMLDIDRFSLFNERHGPDAGDRMLSAVGATLMENAPDSGVCCRYSGERFAVLLPGHDRGAARTTAQTLCQALSALTVTDGEGRDARVSLSAGVATAPGCADNPADLIAAAEDGIFNARQRGGDTVREPGGA